MKFTLGVLVGIGSVVLLVLILNLFGAGFSVIIPALPIRAVVGVAILILVVAGLAWWIDRRRISN